MATYKQIFGKQVKFLSSDPDNEGEGQIWFNSTSNTFKTVGVSEAWSSGAPTINEQKQSYGTGTQTATLLWAGRGQPPAPVLAVTEEYNGTGWAVGGTQTAARASGGGAGTQTASLMIGGTSAPGANLTTVEEYDGSAWTASPALNGAKFLNGTFGSSTAAVTTGGSAAPQVFEVWNNISWANGPAPTGPSTRYGEAGSGTEAAGLISGGFGGGVGMNNSDEYNGTSFSSSTTLNTARGYMGAFGVQTATVVMGGFNPPAYTAATELYDGATWTTSPATLANVSGYGGAAGTSTAGITAGFLTPSGPNSTTTNTEEYNKSTSVITAGAWASGTSLPATRFGGAGSPSGTTTAALYAFGSSPGAVATSYEYDGATWTAGGTGNTARTYLAGIGTQTAAIACGGFDSLTGMTNSEEYNGASWTANPAPTDLNVGKWNTTGCGTQTAGLNFGGSRAPHPTTVSETEEYDGSSWAAGGALPTGFDYPGGAGTQTAGLQIGGNLSPPTGTTTTNEYNGTGWTAGGDMINTRYATAGIGTQISALAAGSTPPASLVVEGYDGTAWSTRPSMATARGRAGSSGTGELGLVMGGSTTAAVEEWTGETSAANIETLTTS